MLAAISVNIIGVSTAPLRVAERADHRLNEERDEERRAEHRHGTRVAATAEVQTTRFLKSDGGMIASFARVSTQRNAATMTQAESAARR